MLAVFAVMVLVVVVVVVVVLVLDSKLALVLALELLGPVVEAIARVVSEKAIHIKNSNLYFIFILIYHGRARNKNPSTLYKLWQPVR